MNKYVCGICGKSYDTHKEAFECFMKCMHEKDKRIEEKKKNKILLNKINSMQKVIKNLCDEYNASNTGTKLYPYIDYEIDDKYSNVSVNKSISKTIENNMTNTATPNEQKKKTCNNCIGYKSYKPKDYVNKLFDISEDRLKDMITNFVDLFLQSYGDNSD